MPRGIGDLRLVEGLKELSNEHPRVTNVRGRGLFVAFDLPDTETRKATLEALDTQDMMGLPCGPRSVRFRPPLIVTEEDVDEGLRRLDRALGAVLG